MKTSYTTLKLFAGYILVLLLMLLSSSANGQSTCVARRGITVVQFNAEFNDANKVPWVNKIKDAKNIYIDISTDTKAIDKYKIVNIPTIIIFNNRKEVARYQANIMMQIVVLQKEIQDKVYEILTNSDKVQ